MIKIINQNRAYKKPRKHLKRDNMKSMNDMESVQAVQRLDRKVSSMIYAAVCIFFLLFMVISSDGAEQAGWNPTHVLESYIADNYPWKDVEVRNVRIKSALGNEAPERIIVEKGPVGKGVFSFMFKDSRRVIVKADIIAYAQVVKSMRPYRKGHVIESNDLYVSKMDIRKMPGSAIKEPESIIGRSLKRSLSSNITIVENMIEISQVVKRGKRVVLRINRRGFNIIAYGKIKEKGYIGMPVKAMNLSSKQDVMGVLIDENTVEVEL